ncbi:hypothetical protein HYW76_04300 [Candidatus Pacearchaeota archaeon]|nr:hypothetical protein [Candidatus Pacearchaeota archaeon]
MDKYGFEFSFNWIFAIVAGAVIIFLAVYFAVQLIGQSEHQINSVTARQISILFEPMETGLAAGKSSYASLGELTRIYNECQDSGEFGENLISASVKSGFNKDWPEKGIATPISNKYIFSDSIEEGKEAYFFSKPFSMPFKVSEVIFFTTKRYCFANSPDFIREEANSLKLKNINIDNCTKEDIIVCFGNGEDCNITVMGQCAGYECESDYDYGEIRKNDKTIVYFKELIYGGIFASPEIYECNVKRLVKRAAFEAVLYKQEADFISDKCGASYQSMLGLIDSAQAYKDSKDLVLMNVIAKEVEQQNDASQCSLW